MDLCPSINPSPIRTTLCTENPGDPPASISSEVPPAVRTAEAPAVVAAAPAPLRRSLLPGGEFLGFLNFVFLIFFLFNYYAFFMNSGDMGL